MLKVISVDIDFKRDDITSISFDGDSSFLDADVLIIDSYYIPRLWKNAIRWPDGITRLSSTSGSDSVMSLFDRRKNEIDALLNAGKIVIAFLGTIVFIDAQLKNTASHTPISNYSWLPLNPIFLRTFRNGSGKTIKLIDDKHLFASYYKAFNKDLEYRVSLQESGKGTDVFLINNVNSPVGWSVHYGKGYIFFIPLPSGDYDIEKLVGVLIHCAKNYYKITVETPEPSWAKEFAIPGERELIDRMDEIQRNIDELNEGKEEIEIKVNDLSKFRALLYENGKPLEDIVISAFRVMGFVANNIKKEDMEHDVILESAEGRAVCEIEGKDKDAINIDKLDQLTRVVDEDFKENERYSEGILIGNPYRLYPLDQRKDPFTDKVKIAVERKQFKMLTTVELFFMVVKILENPDDEELKMRCRKTIIETRGKLIKF